MEFETKIRGQYITVTVEREGRVLEYQLKVDDEGLVLDTVRGDQSGMDSLFHCEYNDHPDFDEE